MSRSRRDEDMGMGATRSSASRGKMTVEEAGRRGGSRGGPRVRELIEEGKEHEDE